jgi:selenide,water dikinase
MGHAAEMAEGSGVKIVVEFDKVPRIAGADFYIEQECIPGGTHRNFASYGHKISAMTEKQKALLCDPQTSGGLLIAVKPDSISKVSEIAKKENFPLFEIGYIEKGNGTLWVEIK